MYFFPPESEPIRQGDIFRWLPKLDLLVGDMNLPLLTEQVEGGLREINWISIAQNQEEINPNLNANVYAKKSTGIVVSQDCDAARAEQILFCEIVPLKDMFSGYHEDNPTYKNFNKTIISQSKKNQKWFYLAEDARIGFARKMSVNFNSAFVVPRRFVSNYIGHLRIGRLNDEVAIPHFRERVSEFFRRYPYNEWYPFNSNELAYYEEDKDIKVDYKYDWQK